MKPADRIVTAVREQFGRPRGAWGHAAGVVMTHRPSNRKRNAWAVSLLDVRAKDRVLEVGFGPGLAIRELSRVAYEGRVYGIDHSDVMLRRARKRNADGVRRGLVDLRLASVDDMPDFGEPFDAVFAVNAALFWRDGRARLESLCGLLRPGGLIAVVHQPRGPGADDASAAAYGFDMAATLVRAGLADVRVETLPLRPAAVCAIGRTPGPAGGGERSRWPGHAIRIPNGSAKRFMAWRGRPRSA